MVESIPHRKSAPVAEQVRFLIGFYLCFLVKKR